ncbi:RNA polymerase sigma-70 factor (ECF subfamily) [Kineococcus xinjiangensis]|uniref:RNA polymerase sigma-70 factor (ECF subfamily) n=1 Tax=Kineococcus xinjiangensis TaxID=512762 RepID=A0A2S6IUY3_9ACTN|nr:sigma-70 family RNA polymerase sigma factor [Kineococcus xinjiangensis]PPK98085.1 RNA polymerase sigma-70 factor (ECF subfamily) [Kineococcus xinjiangensis]
MTVRFRADRGDGWADDGAGAGWMQDSGWAQDPGVGFEEFVRRQGAVLVALARVLLREPAAAQDVVEDVLAKVLLRWERVRDEEDPETYAVRALVSACTSWWRRGGHPPAGGDGDPPGGEAGAAAHDALLLEALRRLPGQQRSVLALMTVAGLDEDDVADVLEVDPEVVRGIAERGLAALGRTLASAADRARA